MCWFHFIRYQFLTLIRKGINDSVKVILDGENLIDFKKPYTFTITIPQGNYRQPYEVQSAHAGGVHTQVVDEFGSVLVTTFNTAWTGLSHIPSWIPLSLIVTPTIRASPVSVMVNGTQTFEQSNRYRVMWQQSSVIDPTLAGDFISVTLDFGSDDAMNLILGCEKQLLLPAKTVVGYNHPQERSDFVYMTNQWDFNGSLHALQVRTSRVDKGVLDSETGRFGNILARAPHRKTHKDTSVFSTTTRTHLRVGV